MQRILWPMALFPNCFLFYLVRCASSAASSSLPCHDFIIYLFLGSSAAHFLHGQVVILIFSLKCRWFDGPLRSILLDTRERIVSSFSSSLCPRRPRWRCVCACFWQQNMSNNMHAPHTKCPLNWHNLTTPNISFFFLFFSFLFLRRTTCWMSFPPQMFIYLMARIVQTSQLRTHTAHTS